MGKIDTKEFIRKAKAKHGNKYDYSHVNYVNTRTEVKIKCKTHGFFNQVAFNHTSLGHGCHTCGIERRKIDTKEFIRRAKEIHGNKYDYSHVDYVKYKTHVKIKCKVHGVFNQTPSNHLRMNLMGGCAECANESRHIRKTKSMEQFIKDARQVHEKTYGYDEVDYKNSHTKVKIECKTHGIFDQTPSNHLNGRGCDKCAMKSRGMKHRKSREQFIKDAKKVWGKKNGYDKAEYLGDKIPLKIKCKIKDHGFFDQRAGNHLSGKEGCKKCVDFSNSKGVQAIELFLKQNKIDYERERRFPDLRNKQPLPLDFWLPKLKIAIEFDGEQHSKIGLYANTKDKLRLIQKRDCIKNQWAKKNRYTMIRISYIQLNTINEILLKKVA